VRQTRAVVFGLPLMYQAREKSSHIATASKTIGTRPPGRGIAAQAVGAGFIVTDYPSPVRLHDLLPTFIKTVRVSSSSARAGNSLFNRGW
jgi:hypothetical protein